jgi:hypothetical protein
MPDPTPPNTASLPERFDGFGKTVEGIVLRGIEHPACELKRCVTLSKDDLTDRLDFIKLLQGLANSPAGTECLIVDLEHAGNRSSTLTNRSGTPAKFRY